MARSNSFHHCLARSIAVLMCSISANGWSQTASSEEPGLFDRIWDAAVLHEDEQNPTVQSFSLVGRYHGQFWAVRANQGNAQDWENRRMIFGFSSTWFRQFTLQAQMYLKSGSEHYDGLYEAFIRWSSPQSDTSISVGRLDYLFTGYERSTSSKKINVIERGLLVNQVMPAEVVGVHARADRGRFSYHAGLFSGGLEEEFSDFKQGTAAVAGMGFDSSLLFDEGKLQLDYLYNGSDRDGNAFRPYRHVISLWHKGKTGRLSMGTDLTVALPRDTPGQIWSLTLEPAWIVLHKVFGMEDSLQIVMRFQFAKSSRHNGLQLQRRYEQEVSQGFGDRYHAIYTGLNYFIYGQNLKLMIGGEYAHMRDQASDGGHYRGWTWFAAVRTYF